MIWKNTIPGVVDSMASRFNETSTYKKSDYVWYVAAGSSPKLYKAKEDISAGAWDASKWEEIVETKEFVNKGNLLAAKKDIHTDVEGNLIYEKSYGEYLEKVVQPYADVEDYDTTYNEGNVLWIEANPDWGISHDTMVIVGPNGDGSNAGDISYFVINEQDSDWGLVGAAKWDDGEWKYVFRQEFTDHNTPVEGNWYGTDKGTFVKYTNGELEEPKWSSSASLQALENNGIETGDYVQCGMGACDLYHVLTMSPAVFKNEVGALDLAITQYEFAPKLSDIDLSDAYYGMLFYDNHQLYAMLTFNDYPNNNMNGDPGLFEIVHLDGCYAAKIERFEQLSYFIRHDAYPATDALLANIFGDGGLPVRYDGDYVKIKGNNFHGWFEPDFGCATFTIKDDPNGNRPRSVEWDLSEVSTNIPFHENSLNGVQLWLDDERSDTSAPVFNWITVKNGQFHVLYRRDNDDVVYLTDKLDATNAVIQDSTYDKHKIAKHIKLMSSIMLYMTASGTDIYGEATDTIYAYNSSIGVGRFGYTSDRFIDNIDYAGRIFLYNSTIDFSHTRINKISHTLNIEAHNSSITYTDEDSGIDAYCDTLFNINFEHSSLYYANRSFDNETASPKVKLFEGVSRYSNFYYTEDQYELPEEQHKMTFEHWTDKEFNIANAVYMKTSASPGRKLMYHTFPAGEGGTDFHAEFIRALDKLTTQLGLTYTATQDASGDYQYTFNLNS